MRLTHSLCTNWDISTGVDVDDERHRVLIGQVSHRLDGDQLWGVSLWRLPEENPEKGLSVGWEMRGRHRRIRLDDLLAYQVKLHEQRAEALDEMTRSAQEEGLYDILDVPPASQGRAVFSNS